ncbi:MAG: hypothetical protein ACRCXZ_10940 [Patescibacteria group bacterium]
MIQNLESLNKHLYFVTKISEFKSKTDYLPYLTAYYLKTNTTLSKVELDPTKLESSISKILNEHFEEDFEISLEKVQWSSINDSHEQFVSYLKNPRFQIGVVNGLNVYESIEEDWRENTKFLEKNNWYQVNTDFMLSYSTVGQVFITFVEDNLVILDFGYSD